MVKFVGISLMIFSLNAWACLTTPDSIELEGATFSEAIKLSTSGNCGFELDLSSAQAVAEEVARQGKSRAELAVWKKENPMPRLDSREYDGWSNRMENIQKHLEKKYPSIDARTHKITVESGEVRFSKKSNKEFEPGTGGPIKGPDGKIVSVIESSGKEVFIFSVDSSGKKDLSKPYLKVVADRQGSAKILAYDQGAQVGQMDVDGEECFRSSLRASGKLNLKGKHYSPGDSGCDGGFIASDFKKPAALKVNGQPAESPAGR